MRTQQPRSDSEVVAGWIFSGGVDLMVDLGFDFYEIWVRSVTEAHRSGGASLPYLLLVDFCLLCLPLSTHRLLW